MQTLWILSKVDGIHRAGPRSTLPILMRTLPLLTGCAKGEWRGISRT